MTSTNLTPFRALTVLALSLATAWNLSAKQSTSVQWSNGPEGMKLVVEGEVRFTEDDTDIESLSADGLLSIEQKSRTARHRLVVRPAKEGGVERTYTRDGKAQAWEPSGKAWLSELLPGLIRNTPLDAPARVDRIRRLKGVAGVLDEISLIKSDGAKRIYFRELFARGDISPELRKRALTQIGEQIRSDGDKASVLIDAIELTEGREPLQIAFLEATDTLHSDGDHRRVLAALLKGPVLKETAFRRTLRSAARISSDGDKASVLVATLRIIPKSDAVFTEFLDAVRTIASDGDKTRVLIEAMELTEESEALQIACLEVADTIHSDGDHRRVLAALLKGTVLKEDVFRRTLRSAARISSDGDKASVLIAAAGDAPQGDLAFSDFLDAAKTIASDGDKARVLAALLKQGDLSENRVSKIRAFSKHEIHGDGDRRRIEKLIEN